MKKVAALLAASIERLSYACGIAGTVALAVMLLLLTVEVILRYVFNTSTMISTEVGAYLFVAVLYFGLAHTLQKNEHISIRVVVHRLNPKAQQLLSQVVVVLNLLVSLVLVWRAWILVVDNFRTRSLFPSLLHTPQYIPQLPLAIGVTIFALQAAVELLKHFYLVKVPEGKDTLEK